MRCQSGQSRTCSERLSRRLVAAVGRSIVRSVFFDVVVNTFTYMSMYMYMYMFMFMYYVYVYVYMCMYMPCAVRHLGGN